MKIEKLKFFGLLFALFVGNATMAQSTVETTTSEKAFQTKSVDGHEVLIFNSNEEKEAWINANPEAYAAKVNEAQQVSVTFLGTLLQVKEELIKEATKPVSTSFSATSPANN